MPFLMYTYTFILAFLMFTLVKHHLLTTLLALEFMVLSIYFILVFLYSGLTNELFCLFLFLSVSVCGGALGLALVSMYVRKKGNELLTISN